MLRTIQLCIIFVVSPGKRILYYKFLRTWLQLYILGNFGVLSLFVVEEKTVVDKGVVEKGRFLFLGRNVCILFFFIFHLIPLRSKMVATPFISV